MRKSLLLILLLLALFGIFAADSNISGSEKMKYPDGPYFGQNPSGEKSEIFALGIISDGNQQHSSLSISPDGKEFWWSEWHVPYDNDKYPQIIQYLKHEKGKWNGPFAAPFSGKWRDGSPAFSADGSKIFFYSRRPLDKSEKKMKDNDIWYVERTDKGWSEPIHMDENINSPDVEAIPALAANDNLYFTSNRKKYKDPTGNNDLYFSRYVNGKYEKAVNIGAPVNTDYAREYGCYIAPDESFIIFSRDSRKFKDGKKISGDRKLMISFRCKDLKWQEPTDLGAEFYSVRFPSISPDGKYLFFTRYTEGANEDYYWIDANFIEKLKSKTAK